MMSRATPVRLPAVALAVLALAALALAAGHRDAAPAVAQAATGEMELRIGDCRDDCVVAPGSTATLTVAASRRPAPGMAGFQTEVFLGGLTYQERPCQDEVKMEPRSLCLGPVVHVGGQIVHGGATGLGELPWPDSTSPVLVEINFACPREGPHTIALAAYPSTNLGSRYKDREGNTIELRTTDTLRLPSGQSEEGAVDQDTEVADTLRVLCRTGGANGGQQNGGTGQDGAPGPGTPGFDGTTQDGTPGAGTPGAGTPRATPTRTPRGGAAGDDGDGGGLGVGWIVLIVVGAAAVAGGGGYAGWRYWQRRRGAGGPAAG